MPDESLKKLRSMLLSDADWDHLDRICRTLQLRGRTQAVEVLIYRYLLDLRMTTAYDRILSPLAELQAAADQVKRNQRFARRWRRREQRDAAAIADQVDKVERSALDLARDHAAELERLPRPRKKRRV